MMENPDKACSEFVGIVMSWIPRRHEPANVSRDFWMPDHSCRVCYECDSQFTIFYRRHHCRLCGRVFCGKCTANSIPISSSDPSIVQEEGERIRVCNFCFKLWEQEMLAKRRGIQSSSEALNPSFLTASLVSTKSSGTANSSSLTPGSMSYSTVPHQRAQYGSNVSLAHSRMGLLTDNHDSQMSQRNSILDFEDTSSNQFNFHLNRSDDEDEEYAMSRSDSESQHILHSDSYYGTVEFDGAVQEIHSTNIHPVEVNDDAKDNGSPLHDNSELCDSRDLYKMTDDAGQENRCDDHPSSIYSMGAGDTEPVDFDNNEILWFPPDPENKEDEREGDFFDQDDDDDATGDWGYNHSLNGSFNGEYRSRDQTNEEHKRATKDIVDGHFRALIAQLLQVENVPMEEGDKGSWFEIITCLSWEAATLLKPDTSKGGGMDPGGYVKIKCIACGHRSQSMVVKGIVCKKNVVHRRMASEIEKPRFLILGGALEYQRVTNSLSSFDTLLRQEMEHLKMAVAKIDAYHPHVLLVEKSVSRFAQDYLLAKNISLVLNIKRPLLERIARCTGAQIIPSIDHLSSQKLGHCDLFHVEKYLEEHGSAGQGGRKMVKTLMYFEGCPKPLGCTILLKGASGDVLKKLKHVIQYGIFAAYHLALETSFLADEGASLPELPLKSPITVALPDKPSTFDPSISIIPGFTTSSVNKPQLTIEVPTPKEFVPTLTSTNSECREATGSSFVSPSGTIKSPMVKKDHISAVFSSSSQQCSPTDTMRRKNKVCFGEIREVETITDNGLPATLDANVPLETLNRGAIVYSAQNQNSNSMVNQPVSSALVITQQENEQRIEYTLPKEELSSDHQSILVSLSTRSVWKGVICERSHLFRIKYYSSFDKPLGRFLRDNLFDQNYKCRSCDTPPEAHVHCYTHHQGSLMISVRRHELRLPGERDGKIWMWHRCLRCPRVHGFPPSTRRVVMSDAAWGLSFGKFLELSFSNHAAASRVASCGHSLHRDCLRFYGYGETIACFRYASIDVNSVYLPPHKLDFNCDHQEWIQSEANEVANRTELLFIEVLNALQQIAEGKPNFSSANGNIKILELRNCILELEEMLHKEKAEFADSLLKLQDKEARRGQPVIDILEVNKLRRQLLFQSYLWDQRLIFVAGSGAIAQEMLSCLLTREREKRIASEKIAELNLAPKSPISFISFDTFLSDSRNNVHLKGNNLAVEHQEVPYDQQNIDRDLDSFQGKRRNILIATCTSACDQLDHLDHLEDDIIVRRTLSDGQVPNLTNLSETFDAKWTGEAPMLADTNMSDSASVEATVAMSVSENSEERNISEAPHSFASALLSRFGDSTEDFSSWISMPFLHIYHSMNKNLDTDPTFSPLSDYNPIYVSLFRELERQGGARLLLPVGVDDTIIPIYDDEPTSIISYALVSPDYRIQISDERERTKDNVDTSFLFPSNEFGSSLLAQSSDEMTYGRFGSNEDDILSLSVSRGSLVLDPLISTKALHAGVSFCDEGPLGKVRYSVTCYYAKCFDTLRRICCPSELDFVRSLSRCKKWGAQGGKSNVFFAKSLDERFIIKQVTKTELESFIKFAPEYFRYLSEAIGTGSPTCLAKILGIYQVTSKHLKGGKELKMDVLVMENLLFGQNVTRLYDLKGSLRSRYNTDCNNKVLLDQNLLEATSPIFVGNKAKRLLERAVWNDTSFLASVDVMDYSLLVGVDEVKHKLVMGIIDFMRQYTWDKHLETWVKASGILGGPKNVAPTVISPKQYKKRFRKAMAGYFHVVPDQWSPPAIVPTSLKPDSNEDNQKDTSVVES